MSASSPPVLYTRTDASKRGNATRYINHSSNANVRALRLNHFGVRRVAFYTTQVRSLSVQRTTVARALVSARLPRTAYQYSASSVAKQGALTC